MVLEDGKPQTIELFTRVDLPYERPEPPAPPPVPLDVQTNARPFEGRLYVIVMDGLHITARGRSWRRRPPGASSSATSREGDLAAVVHTSGGASYGQG